MTDHEGSLDAPTRHVLDWQSPDIIDPDKIDIELCRVFDICHGCRRCFNLCDSFPQLFDLIDESESCELDTVDSKDFKPVIDACTLCDMCFMTKCPLCPAPRVRSRLPPPDASRPRCRVPARRGWLHRQEGR